jgi:hypothetical protein
MIKRTPDMQIIEALERLEHHNMRTRTTDVERLTDRQSFGHTFETLKSLRDQGLVIKDENGMWHKR